VTGPPTPTALTAPKISINSKDGKQVSSLSLASIRKKKEWEQQQKPVEKVGELPNDPFTQEQLEQYWKKWQEQKTKKREQNLASLFQLSQPKIVNENIIEYTVPSPLNKVELEREFVYFLPYIREGLKNYDIQIKVVVKETEEKNFIYTPEEKYNRLREINPAIDELLRKLDLDL
jgi:DNA polymerase-3 subunit gamma/tau